MLRSHRHGSRVAPVATLLAALALLAVTATPAAAAPISAGEASAFGGTITVGGEELIPPTPAVAVTLGEEASDTTIDIPAEPLAVSGTLNADAAVLAESTLESVLAQAEQEVPGPYNARAVGSVEEAEVLVDAVDAEQGISLVTADVIRGEAVAVCTAEGEVQYSAASEILNLNIGGEPVPLNEPLEQIIDGLNTVLAETTLNQLVDIQRNVVTKTADGAAVDALVVTLLDAAGEEPLAQVRLGHAEVKGVACAAPECSDGIDNDDPEDTLVDANDPGCHTDLDASNPASYDPLDDDESNPVPAAAVSPAAPAQLPATGSNAASTAGLAGAMAAGALAIVALRRRLA